MSLVPGRKLRFEQVEDRTMMAGDVTVGFENGTVYIHGDEAGNFVLVGGTDVPGQVVISRNISGTNTPADTTLNGQAGDLVFNNVTNVEANMNGGDDKVFSRGLNLAGNFTVNLNAGNDLFEGSKLVITGNLTLNGQTGNDRIYTGIQPTDLVRLLTDVNFVIDNWVIVNGKLAIDTNDGDDEIKTLTTYVDGSITIFAGTGNDTYNGYNYLTKSKFDLRMEDGDDFANLGYLTVIGSTNCDAGFGNDTLAMYASNLVGVSTFSGNTGYDQIILQVMQVHADMHINSGSEADFVKLYNVLNDNAITNVSTEGGADKVEVLNSRASIMNVDTGNDNDMLTVIQSGFQLFYGELGNGDDTADIRHNSAYGLFSLKGGAGKDKYSTLYNQFVQQIFSQFE